jgi:hypothetical protein
MMNLLRNIKAAFGVAGREEGQGTFEWLLLIGVVVVALILAVSTDFPGTLVTDTIADLGTEFQELFDSN